MAIASMPLIVAGPQPPQQAQSGHAPENRPLSPESPLEQQGHSTLLVARPEENQNVPFLPPACLCGGRLLLVGDIFGFPAQHIGETSEQNGRLALVFLAAEIDFHPGH